MGGIAITGMGLITSLGHNQFEIYDKLSRKEDGIRNPLHLSTIHTNLPVGEVQFSNRELEEFLNLPENHTYTRAAMLGIMAIKDLLNSLDHKFNLDETGFISGTSVGGIDATEKYFLEYENSEKNRRFIKAQHPGFTTNKISEYFKLNTLNTTISTACSSAANAIMLGARMIKSGRLKRVIVGGSDCLTKFTLNGFNSLKILSEEKCKTFDADRTGLNLGEAAAYLMLEADDVIENKKVIARLVGYGNANDAYHQTASSENGEGAFLAMSKALKTAGIQQGSIDYINAHGTGTINNDLSESVAIIRVFDKGVPLFSSTKGYTGHTLGAAGAVEAVFSLMSLQKQLIFPNLNFNKVMPETGMRPVTELKRKSLKRILSNSLGFGGNCTSLIFESNG